jgi:membrane-bound lytic murein transglycosylase A
LLERRLERYLAFACTCVLPLALALLGGCQTLTAPESGPRHPPTPASTPAPSHLPPAGSPAPVPSAPAELPFSGPLPIPWSAPLTGLQVRFERDDEMALTRIDDADWLAAWPAWLASCRALTSIRHPHRLAWERPCAGALLLNPDRGAQVRAFFAANMDPYRVVALDGPEQLEHDTGLITGYYEPEIEGRRERGEPFVVPVYGLPPIVPTAPRADIEATGQMRGQELLWVRDPIEAFFLEVQGSGRVHLGQGTWIRLAYAGSNGQAYRSIGRWLIDQGELPAEHVSMQAISDWAHGHPQRVRELLNQNPRMVFFREQALAREDAGPVGTLGVVLTPGVSVAVDPKYLPLGAPLLLSIASAPSASPAGDGAPINVSGNIAHTLEAPLPARLALAQDTGGAIHGPLRVDWYWGQGPGAGEIAGRQRSMGTIRLLVPRGVAPASLL